MAEVHILPQCWELSVCVCVCVCVCECVCVCVCLSLSKSLSVSLFLSLSFTHMHVLTPSPAAPPSPPCPSPRSTCISSTLNKTTGSLPPGHPSPPTLCTPSLLTCMDTAAVVGRSRRALCAYFTCCKCIRTIDCIFVV
jgi:hypothetical protein